MFSEIFPLEYTEGESLSIFTCKTVLMKKQEENYILYGIVYGQNNVLPIVWVDTERFEKTRNRRALILLDPQSKAFYNFGKKSSTNANFPLSLTTVIILIDTPYQKFDHCLLLVDDSIKMTMMTTTMILLVQKAARREMSCLAMMTSPGLWENTTSAHHRILSPKWLLCSQRCVAD